MNSIEKGTVTMCQNDILSTTGILENFGTFVAGAENGKIVLLHPNGDELSSQPGDCSITRENPTDKEVVCDTRIFRSDRCFLWSIVLIYNISI